eukprot:m.214571 g.214571  ORF g.214571 m.214571 type:complete len:96 (+) comp25586_c1_seq1:572-859(+)
MAFTAASSPFLHAACSGVFLHNPHTASSNETPNNKAWATRQRRGWQFLGRDTRHPWEKKIGTGRDQGFKPREHPPKAATEEWATSMVFNARRKDC